MNNNWEFYQRLVFFHWYWHVYAHMPEIDIFESHTYQGHLKGLSWERMIFELIAFKLGTQGQLKATPVICYLFKALCSALLQR